MNDGTDGKMKWSGVDGLNGSIVPCREQRKEKREKCYLILTSGLDQKKNPIKHSFN